MTEGGARNAAARIVLMTAPDADVAETVVRALVEERLAACGNIVPGVVSLYRWEGAIQRDAEVLVVLKTSAARAPAVVQRISELHPYDVPEAVVIEVESGLSGYLQWIHDSTTGS